MRFSLAIVHILSKCFFLLYLRAPRYWSSVPCAYYTQLISPLGIVILKGLYFTAVIFSSSFFLYFQCLMSEVTERISTKPGYIFTYDCYLKNLVWTPQGIYRPWTGGTKPLFETAFELWPNVFLQWNMTSTIGKKPTQLQNLNPKPKFEGIQIRNTGFEIAIQVWNPCYVLFMYADGWV